MHPNEPGGGGDGTKNPSAGAGDLQAPDSSGKEPSDRESSRRETSGGQTPNSRNLFDAQAVFVDGPVSPTYATRCVERFCGNHAVGAHVVFLGQVRADRIAAGTVVGIDYTAHESMARKAFTALIDRISSQYELLDLELRHSLGHVPAGGISLLIAVATGHRAQAYEASRAILEAIKTEVPIYGRELTAQDRSSWKVNR